MTTSVSTSSLYSFFSKASIDHGLVRKGCPQLLWWFEFLKLELGKYNS